MADWKVEEAGGKGVSKYRRSSSMHLFVDV